MMYLNKKAIIIFPYKYVVKERQKRHVHTNCTEQVKKTITQVHEHEQSEVYFIQKKYYEVKEKQKKSENMMDHFDCEEQEIIIQNYNENINIKIQDQNKRNEHVQQIKEHVKEYIQNSQNEKQKFIKQENGIYDDCMEVPIKSIRKNKNIMEFYTNKDQYVQNCEQLTQHFAMNYKEAFQQSIINANLQKAQILYVNEGIYNGFIIKGKVLAKQTEEIMCQLLQTMPFRISYSVAIIIVILVMLTLTQKTIKNGYFLYSLAKNYLTERMQQIAQKQLLAKIKALIQKIQQQIEIEKLKKNKYVDSAEQKLMEDALEELLKKLVKSARRKS